MTARKKDPLAELSKRIGEAWKKHESNGDRLDLHAECIKGLEREIAATEGRPSLADRVGCLESKMKSPAGIVRQMVYDVLKDLPLGALGTWSPKDQKARKRSKKALRRSIANHGVCDALHEDLRTVEEKVETLGAAEVGRVRKIRELEARIDQAAPLPVKVTGDGMRLAEREAELSDLRHVAIRKDQKIDELEAKVAELAESLALSEEAGKVLRKHAKASDDELGRVVEEAAAKGYGSASEAIVAAPGKVIR